MPGDDTISVVAGTRARTIRTLVILALLTAAAPLSVDIYTPSLPRIQADLGGGAWLAEGSVTTCLLGIAVGQLLWGPLSDRFGRRPVVLIGAIGWTLASAASAFAPTAAVLLAVRVAVGLCGAAGIVVARSIVRDISSDDHLTGSRIGMLSVVTGIAPVIAPTIGAGIAQLFGWRADFLALALLGALTATAFALWVPETMGVAVRTDAAPPGAVPADAAPPGTGRMSTVRTSAARALASALRNRQLLGAALAIGLFSLGFYAYIATAAFIVEREYGHSPAVFAGVFATNAAAMLVATLVFRAVVRRRHAALPLGIGLAISGLSGAGLLVGAGLNAPEGLIWTLSALFAAGAGFVLPAAHSWGQATAVASGAASALTGAFQFFGGALGSPVTGVIGTTAAHLGGLIALACVLAAGAWLFGLSARR
ncbi:MFS transporter [Microbacterium protaetiae]|uniref:MFS transporter n=1 Tax=Microbacterium protaetiae TaxID=2509458 RepID=UPI0013EAD21E|nr:MFS transporter [Microbacterium protaetiae]